MKQTLILAAAASCFFAACNPGTSGDSTTDTVLAARGNAPPVSTDEPNAGAGRADVTGCYLRVLGRDTFAVHLEQTGNQVSGRLSFNNFEKDKSTGTVLGREEDDIVKLFYTFQSEGMTSVSEVYLKRSARGLIHGTGDVVTRGDTTMYANPIAVKYADAEVWEKLPCAKLPAKYQ